MEKKLNFSGTLVEGFNLGINNFLNLILTVVLFLLTFWIPYLNIGTTIGFYKVIVALSKGEAISPTSIFSRENYKGLGDFFLLFGLQTAGLAAAAVLFVAPILALAWQFAFYFFVDKKMSPLKALSTSYDVTCGEKWTLFFVYVVLILGIMIVTGLLALVPKVGGLLCFIGVVVVLAIVLGVEASLYKYFSSKLAE